MAPYVRTFGGGDNRWGDFSSITPDPSSPTGFCAFNEYAWTHGTSILGETGRWTTQVADINVPAGTPGPVISTGDGLMQFFPGRAMAAFGAAGAGETGRVNPLDGQSPTDFFAGATQHHG